MHALIIEEDAWVALMIEDALLDLGYTSFDVADTGDGANANRDPARLSVLRTGSRRPSRTQAATRHDRRRPAAVPLVRREITMPCDAGAKGRNEDEAHAASAGGNHSDTE